METQQKEKLKTSHSVGGTRGGQLTRLTGCPVAHNKNSLTAGPHGPVLLEDSFLLEKINQFTREQTPPRNVHALGTGAYGVFRAKNDISKYTKAQLFTPGEETDVLVRFSGIFTERGEAETVRDPRGFAIKFYTKEGNWDLLAINTPVFNCRDAKLGPDAIHAFKRDPRTGDWNPTNTWDFILNHPEGLYQALMLYSDRDGTPMSFRYMHAYGCNTFSLLNEKNERFWVKFHIKSPLGAKGFTQTEAKIIAGEDPDFLSRDLREAIQLKEFPKWKFYIQVMPEEEGYSKPITFDPTKVWDENEYPLIEVGELELNKNPVDYFAEIEQVAFSPLNIVPGIGFSPDKLLQGRLLIYDQAQHHRLGPNFKQLYVNKPKSEVNTTYVMGFPQLDIKNKFPHYYPSIYGGPEPNPKYKESPLKCDGPADFYDMPGEGSKEDYYLQPGIFYKSMEEKDKVNLCLNIASSWEKIPEDLVQKLLPHFERIDSDLGKRLSQLYSSFQDKTKKKSEGEYITLLAAKTLLPKKFESAF